MPTEEERLLEEFKKLSLDQKRELMSSYHQTVARSLNVSANTSKQERKSSGSSQDTNASDAPKEILSPEMQRGAGASSVMDAELGAFLGDRPRARIGPQGEHVSAYVLYEEMIYSVLDGGNVRDAGKRLLNAFRSLPLDDKALESLDRKISEFKDVIDKSIPREERKAITRTLRGVNFIADPEVMQELNLMRQESLVNKNLKEGLLQKLDQGLGRISVTDDYTKVKNDIRIANRAKLSKLVGETMDICLSGANKMIFASFPNEGCPKNPNTNHEKSSKNILKAVSDFIRTIEVTRAMEDKDSQDFKDTILQLQKKPKEFYDKMGVNKDEIPDLVANGPQSLSRGAIKNISDQVGKLFWHPYIEKPLSVDDEEWKRIQNPLEAGKKPKYNKGTESRNNNYDTLFQVAARHLVIVFNCFDGLINLDVEQKEILEATFLGSIIESQGWKKSGLKLYELKDGVREQFYIDYKEGIYCMKGSRKYKEIQQEQELTPREGLGM